MIERGLLAHGAGEVVLPPKSHIHLDDRFNGHFNILPGFAAPRQAAGVKVVGDYVDNHKVGACPPEVAMLTLYDPATGVPRCLMDATLLTWLRTGAVTGIGAKYLARPNSSVVAISARARQRAQQSHRARRALSAARGAHHQQAAGEPRAAGRRGAPDARPRRAADGQLGGSGARRATSWWRRRGSSALRCSSETAWLEPGALLVTYGWVMAVDPALPFRVDKLVVDDWAQCQHGGQLHPLIASGALRREHVHAEIGEIVHGTRVGRADPGERIIFWHRALPSVISSSARGSTRRPRPRGWHHAHAMGRTGRMNLRAFLHDLESKSPEEIWRIPGEVEPGSDITALVLELERRGEYPVLWFERVRGSRFPVVTNLFGHRRRYARAPSGCPWRACTTNG